MSTTSKQLIATIEFCETNFISEYSIEKLLQAWGVKNQPKCNTPAFLNDLIGFLKSLPLVCFNNSANQVGKVIEQIRKIMLSKSSENANLSGPVNSGLNIIRARKQTISYI